MYVIIGIIVFLFAVKVKPEECVTPNKEKAECVSLYSCSVLLDALGTKQGSAIEFVRQSNCGGTSSNPRVCCGSSGNFTVKNGNTLPNITEKLNLLPSRRFCGFQHSDDYRSTKNDSLPKITEFPWLAALVRIHTNQIMCGGSLINRRYVITTANCVFSRQPPEGVYLGEYHVNNKTDCVREPPFDEECSTPVEVFDIEKAIPHPMFNRKNNANDIALLRLNRTVTYSEYIRPICLPLPGTTFAKVGDVMTSSGWGYNNLSEFEGVEIKKKIFTTLIENEQCRQAYRNALVVINENNLCTVRNDNNSNVECLGDGGGPLLFSSRNQWHQEGIISFFKDCEGNYPQGYTRVVKYIDWILENIEK